MADTSKTTPLTSIKSGVVGATIGAVAAGAAVYLSDKKNREKLTKKATQVKDKAQAVYQTAQKHIDGLREDTKDTVEKTKKEVAKAERRIAAHH